MVAMQQTKQQNAQAHTRRVVLISLVNPKPTFSDTPSIKGVITADKIKAGCLCNKKKRFFKKQTKNKNGAAWLENTKMVKYNL